MYSLIPILYSEKIKSEIKNLFDTYFYFLKRVFFPKKVLPSSHSWKLFFEVAHWNLVLLNVCDPKNAAFSFKMPKFLF